MDMENGDQVSKQGCLCPQDLGGGDVITPKILGGEGNYPKDSTPILYTPLITFQNAYPGIKADFLKHEINYLTHTL